MDESEQGAAHKYLVVRDHLAGLVAQELRVGDAIPSERHLSQQFGLSRMTVRQAVDTLVTDGVLVREQGRGTFVAPQRIDFEMRLTTFGEEMRRRGMEPATTVLSAQVVAATPGRRHRARDRAAPEGALPLPRAQRRRLAHLHRAGLGARRPRARAVRRGPPASMYEALRSHRARARVGRGHAVRRRGDRHRGVPARARRRACRAARRAPHLLGRRRDDVLPRLLPRRPLQRVGAAARPPAGPRPPAPTRGRHRRRACPDETEATAGGRR